MASRIQQRPPGADSFHQFPTLVDEIRLMIWEYTWPAPRVIEAAMFNNPEAQEDSYDKEEPVEIVNLRLAGRLSTMLNRVALGYRIVEDGPVEHCPDPVALQVCRESRMHTLSRYRVMTSLAGSFYYHPQRDVIFFGIDVADDHSKHMPFLERYHKTELKTLETVLVLAGEWPKSPAEKGASNTLDCISHLRGLNTIQILWEGPESGSEESMELDDDGKEETPQHLAERLRLSFPAVIRHEKCTAKKIEVIDTDGNLY